MKRIVTLLLLALVTSPVYAGFGGYLKQSTAKVIKFGPMVDKTDGVTAESTLTNHAAHIKLSKNGGDFAAKNDATVNAHDEDGYWDVSLNTTDTGTLGTLVVKWSDPNAVPKRMDYQIVTANYYDTVCGTDKFTVDVEEIANSANGVSNIVEQFYTHWATYWNDPNSIPNVRLVAIADAAGILTASGGGSTIQTDTSGFVKVSSGTGTGQVSLSSGTVTTGTNNDKTGYGLADSAITTAKFAAGAINAAAIATDALGSDELAATAVAEVAGAVWDIALASHSTEDSVGNVLNNLVVEDAGGLYQFTANTLELGPGGGAEAAAIADAVWDEVRTDHVTASTFGQGVASVQGNVTGSMAGSVASVTAGVTLADGALTVAKIADAAITAPKIANNAIGAAQISAGGTGAIADAVWDEVRTGHTTASTFGEGVASVQGSVTGPVASVAGAVGSVTAGVSLADNAITAAKIATDAIGADELAAGGLAEIADATWDELITGHTTNDSFANVLDDLTEDDAGAYRFNANALEMGPSGGSSAAAIADAVWDELRADHTTASTFGQGSASVQGNVTGSVGSVTGAVGSVTGAVASVTNGVTLADGAVTVAKIADNAITSAKIATDAIGSAQLAATATAEEADAIWDEVRSGHTTAGTFGQGSASVQGNVTGSVASVTAGVTLADDAITAAKIAVDAIGSSELAASGAAELADATWDEVRTGHTTADSYGKVLNDVTELDSTIYRFTTNALEMGPGGGATAPAIADAVWDEVRSGHVTSGTFGQGSASVQGNITGSVTSVTGAVGSVTAGVSLADSAITGAKYDGTTAVAQTGNTFTRLGAPAGASVSADIAAVQVIEEKLNGMVEADGGVYRYTTNALEQGPGGGATEAAIADAVWNEARAGHTTGGSFGEGVASVQGNLTGSVESVTSGVTVTLNNDKSDYTITNGSLSAAKFDNSTAFAQTGDTFARLGAPAGSNVSADVATLDTMLDKFNGMVELDGSVYRYTTNSVEQAPTGGGGSAGTIADAVWDEVRTDHTTAGTFGQGSASVQGSVTGSVASVTGAVGSVTAGVTLASSAITSATFAAGAITAAAIATDAIGSDELGATGLAELADAVWDEIITGHTGDDSFANIIDDLTELDSGIYRFTLNSLENAPSGSSITDWTAGEREQIRSAIGVNGTKTTAIGGQLQAIRQSLWK